MKKVVDVCTILFLVVFAAVAVADVANTKHNLSASRPPGAIGSDEIIEICVFCHTPHRANATGELIDAPLWNRKNTGTVYTMYAQARLQGTVALSPNVESMMCLSCHDGSLALNNMANPLDVGSDPVPELIGDATRLTADGKIATTSYAFVGGDLTDDHPVSVEYDDTVYHLRLMVDIDSRILFGTEGTVECSTCHSAHGTLYDAFLRMSNENSALCLGCHNV